MYSNEAERANWDIYDDLKFKETLDLSVYINTLQRFKSEAVRGVHRAINSDWNRSDFYWSSRDEIYLVS